MAASPPQIVGKRPRRLTDLDLLLISLFAKGLGTGEILAHLLEVYVASVSKGTVSRITEKVVEHMTALVEPAVSRRGRRRNNY